MAFRLPPTGSGSREGAGEYPGYWRVHVGLHIQPDDLYVGGRPSRPEPVPEELIGGLVTQDLTILRAERRRQPR